LESSDAAVQEDKVKRKTIRKEIEAKKKKSRVENNFSPYMPIPVPVPVEQRKGLFYWYFLIINYSYIVVVRWKYHFPEF
jgi:hypothetical protein